MAFGLVSRLDVQGRAEALALVSEHLEERPVVAVVYSHSHGDHFRDADLAWWVEALGWWRGDPRPRRWAGSGKARRC